MFTAMGEGGYEISTLLSIFGKFYSVKLSTRGKGKKRLKYVNVVFERPHMPWFIAIKNAF